MMRWIALAVCVATVAFALSACDLVASAAMQATGTALVQWW